LLQNGVNPKSTLKEIKMKTFIATLVSVFALSAFAADTAPATPAPAKVEKKAEVKPHKSSDTKADKKVPTATTPAPTTAK
jgi:hypothetical protein